MLIRLLILHKFHIIESQKSLPNFLSFSKISVTFYNTTAQEWKSDIETTILNTAYLKRRNLPKSGRDTGDTQIRMPILTSFTNKNELFIANRLIV
jgi:hypothetical protein